MTHHHCTFAQAIGNSGKMAAADTAAPSTATEWSAEQIAEFAAHTFEPWDASEETVPSESLWLNPHLMAVRMAFAIMCKTKPELIAMIAALSAPNSDLAQQTADMLEHTAQALRAYADMVDAAHARLLCAAVVHATGGDVS